MRVLGANVLPRSAGSAETVRAVLMARAEECTPTGIRRNRSDWLGSPWARSLLSSWHMSVRLFL